MKNKVNNAFSRQKQNFYKYCLKVSSLKAPFNDYLNAYLYKKCDKLRNILHRKETLLERMLQVKFDFVIVAKL
ncbi:hypothetical protein BpHYR1_011477 [Brachionus plicatilis]|uniref:Uncharacterized protein n=1 Tax=Brachionus plicatilis TaxID=10195 RepID=A0A3M7QF16_BRAPC|nr:hypothetical protein BpHYR1_011477 [Brachionus plicatilis]